VRYWSKIATFSYPLAFNAPVGGVPVGIPVKNLVLRKQSQRVTDRQSDGRRTAYTYFIHVFYVHFILNKINDDDDISITCVVRSRSMTDER